MSDDPFREDERSGRQDRQDRGGALDYADGHGTDGWVERDPPGGAALPRSSPTAPLAHRASGRALQGPSDEEARRQAKAWIEEIDRGKALAIIAHASILFGLPVFLIALVLRDNRFALHHAKAAGVNFAFFLFLGGLTFLSCGIFLPAMLLCYIPALVGIVLAANGQLAGPFGFGDLGERIFGRIQAKELDLE